VLAYAYEVHGDDVLLRVYDPNQPRDNGVHLRFNVRTVAERIVVQHNVKVHEADGRSLRPIYCFARMNYTHRTPTVATPPRPPRPPVEVPRQLSLEIIDVDLLASSVIERGRKKYEVFLCGEREFDFKRLLQTLRITIAAKPISYIDPQVTWMLNDAPVPPGTDQTVRPHPSEHGHAFTEQDATGAHTDPPVTVRTSTNGMLLRVTNDAADGTYGLTARAVVTERDGSEAKRWSIAFGFLGLKEVVPGLVEAWDRCFIDWIDSLREESPTDEAIAAAAYAQLGRPLDPIWDPDPLQIQSEWREAVIDPDEAQLLDPAQQVDPGEVVAITTTGSERVIITKTGTEVLTIDPGTDEMVQVNPEGSSGVTVINTTGRALVVVNPATHEAVAVIPANQEVTVSVVKKSP
jgi:hypothetical protein